MYREFVAVTTEVVVFLAELADAWQAWMAEVFRLVTRQEPVLQVVA